jgi:hypothetical protein
MAWLKAFQALLSRKQDWVAYKAANAKFCRTEFSGERNVAVLNNINAASPSLTATSIEGRLKDLLFSKSPVVLQPTVHSDSLRAGLTELSRARARSRKMRRFQRRKPDDLWPFLSPAFEDIRQSMIDRGIHTASRYLQLSDALHDRPYVEYPLVIDKGRLGSVACAFTSEGLQDGELGIELVTPDGHIARNTAVELSSVDLNLPVKFDLEGVIVPSKDVWRVRFFTRSDWPIYVFELAEYTGIKLKRRAVAPFVKFSYVS